MDWLEEVNKHNSSSKSYVIISVVETKGSAPCSVGEKIIYSGEDNFYGSIGGGNFEYKAIQRAQDLIDENARHTEVVRYPLGASLGQCCGGYVKVMFESFVDTKVKTNEQGWLSYASNLSQKKNDFVLITSLNSEGSFCGLEDKLVLNHKQIYDDSLGNIKSKELLEIINSLKDELASSGSTNTTILRETEGLCCESFVHSSVQAVVVFGAGHIARALMSILTKLPISIYWIDDRQSQFDQYDGDVSSINILCDKPAEVVLDLPNDAYCMIITYSHQLDFEICEQIILRDSFCYLGVIGSLIKGNKFRKRLLNKGFSEHIVDKLMCPIGLKYKYFKSPITIAVSIATELINFLERKRKIQSI